MVQKKKAQTVRYIIVTGGVISGSGKGITAASIAACLKARQLKVSIQKFDMYLNVDAGTLKPGQHGEVYVTTDGAETDLDMGHYERFLNQELDRQSSVMQGAILRELINKERAGDFLGDDVQIIPHVTDLIQSKIIGAAQGSDVHIVELGGTVGDYESLAFIEAARQLAHRVGQENVLYVHLVYLPYLQVSAEIKTKPAQSSIRTLRGLGISPHILVCRYEHPIDTKYLIQKLHLLTSIAKENILTLPNVDTVYRVPLLLEQQKGAQQISDWLAVKRKPDLSYWRDVVRLASKTHPRTVKIALIAKYLDNADTYKSVMEALRTAAWYASVNLEVTWVDAEKLEKLSPSEVVSELIKFAGILVPGGFGRRGSEGMIAAAIYALQHNMPYFGICLGMQILTIAFARLSGLENANSKEFDDQSPHQVITDLEGQQGLHQTGGTMRLGSYPCDLQAGSLAQRVYRQQKISERHRHRFEFNPEYAQALEAAGLKISGVCPDNQLVEIVEVPKNDYILGCQFHPEFSSRPMKPQPLFLGFLKAAKKRELKISQNN